MNRYSNLSYLYVPDSLYDDCNELQALMLDNGNGFLESKHPMQSIYSMDYIDEYFETGALGSFHDAIVTLADGIDYSSGSYPADKFNFHREYFGFHHMNGKLVPVSLDYDDLLLFFRDEGEPHKLEFIIWCRQHGTVLR